VVQPGNTIGSSEAFLLEKERPQRERKTIRIALAMDKHGALMAGKTAR